MTAKRADGLVIERDVGMVRLREKGQRGWYKGKIVAEAWRRQEGWVIYYCVTGEDIYLGKRHSIPYALALMDTQLEDTNYAGVKRLDITG